MIKCFVGNNEANSGETKIRYYGRGSVISGRNASVRSATKKEHVNEKKQTMESRPTG